MKMTFLLAALAFCANSAAAMTLEEYLAQVGKNNKSLQALDLDGENIKLQFLREDRDLIPYFKLSGSYLTDKSPSNQFMMMGASEVKMTEGAAAIGKRFASGTSVELKATVNETDAPGLAFPGLTTPFSAGSLGIAVSQSLWRDFFGASTRLRYERQELLSRSASSANDVQRKLALNEAESAFWDYLFAQENLKIARNSVERGKRIENWTRRRVNDGISDRADLFQAQSLVAANQMRLVTAEDTFANAQRKIRDSLEIPENQPTPELKGDLSKSRSLLTNVAGKTGKVVQIDAYAETVKAKAVAIEAKETEDSYRPDLVLSGAYNTNSKEDSIPRAAEKWGETTRPTARVGLEFKYLFDTDVKRGAQESARATALSAKLKAERKMLEGESAWIELNRRYVEMSKIVGAAEQVSQLRGQYARAQAELFNKGRSITNTVVQAEDEAAAAELDLTRLRAELRKLETQGRLFVVIEE